MNDAPPLTALSARRNWLHPATWLAAASSAAGWVSSSLAQPVRQAAPTFSSDPTQAPTQSAATTTSVHQDEPLETRLDPATGTLLSYERWPVFPLVDATGRQVDLHRDLIAGHTVVIVFFYTQCRGSCPVTTGRLINLWASLANSQRSQVRFISVSLEPWTDTPPVLASWAADIVPSDADWHLLTGDAQVITSLRRHLGFYDLDPAVDANPRRHAAMVMMGNDRTHRWLSLPAVATLRQWRSTLSRCCAPV
jgi:protein SCO1